MLKSLSSGVSGLQAHQIAMDVESNNIANVNTIGFKYSRANFSNLLAQVNQIATAPQGDLGGKNSTGVGLGTTVSSMTRIDSQGSVQNTDKNTDCAIQGDGYFIVSADAGKTLSFTRSGDFSFDASGNFVDNNGYIVQGWVRDATTGKVDSTAPITQLKIPPGLTTPAQASSKIVLKANLDSGNTVNTFSAISSLDQFAYAADLNRDGKLNNSDSLATPQTTYDNTYYQTNPSVQGDANPLTSKDQNNENTSSLILTDSKGNIIEQGMNMGVMVNSSGSSFLLQQGQGEYIGFRSATTTSTGGYASVLASTGGSAGDGTVDAGSIAFVSGDLTINGTNIFPAGLTTTAGNTSAQNAVQIAAQINTLTGTTGVNATVVDTTGNGVANHIVLTSTTSTGTIAVTASANGQKSGLVTTAATVSSNGTTSAGALNITAGDITINGVAIGAITSAATSSSTNNTTAIVSAINAKQALTGVTAIAIDTTGNGIKDHIQLVNDNTGSVKNISVSVSATGVSSGLSNANGDAPMKQFRYTSNTTLNPVGWSGNTYYFTTSEDLRRGMQTLAGQTSYGATVTVDTSGKFQVANPNDTTVVNPSDSTNKGSSMTISVYSISDATTIANSTFDNTIKAISGTLPAASTGTRSSQAFNVPTHSASIDVYDSLGSKHTVKVDFTKSAFDTTTGSTWKMLISVPLPAEINPAGGTTGVPVNMIQGEVKFGPDGSLTSFSPPNVSFTANNGSAPSQNINLVMGTASGFDGLTSFDSNSTTSGISQDGYTGGDLVGIRIDQSGTLVGSFSNGRSFGLAQIAMAKFANNGGLSENGGNLYSQSANSGDPIIGTASNGGRGFIQSSALESSNVDLSRSLTELIVIQRGYQANSKTITTSDQLLQTLIGMKQ